MGYEYLFLSNSDNLCASLDPLFLRYMDANDIDFLIEFTPRMDIDIKGGTLVNKNGKAFLVETAQFSNKILNDFKSSGKIKYFNTNNIWLNLQSLKEVMDEQLLSLPLILNFKSYENLDIVQFETAMGSIINYFDKSGIVVVDRDRFCPIKTTNDLFLLQSDLFCKDKNGFIKRSNDKSDIDLPFISLGSGFRSINDYSGRMRENPSIKNLNSLKIEGDVILEVMLF